MRETRFLSLLSDGSTDAGIIEQETVFARYVDKQGQPWTKFVDIVPLESATPDGVCNAVTTSLETIDIDQETLKKKLVGCNFGQEVRRCRANTKSSTASCDFTLCCS